MKHIPIGDRPATVETQSTASEPLETERVEVEIPVPVAEEVCEEKRTAEKPKLEDFIVQAMLGRGYL